MKRLEPILSHDEVRVLLDAAQSPIQTERVSNHGIALQAEPVDLLADDRYLRLLIPGLKVGYARVAESLRRVLTSVLRSKVEITDEEPEILGGRGLMSVAEHAACLIVLRLETPDQEPTSAILALDPTFTFSVIERLFGGGGKAPLTPGGRSPTALERRMLLRAMQPLVDELNANLEPAGYFRLTSKRIESRLDLVPGYSPDVTALHVPFTMTIGQQLASISLAMPANALEGLRGKLGSARVESANSAAMTVAMHDVGLRVAVELGTVELTLRQILDLTPGVVLTLNRNRSDELPVQIEGVGKFSGVPVQDDGVIAVEITGRARSGAMEKTK